MDPGRFAIAKEGHPSPFLFDNVQRWFPWLLVLYVQYLLHVDTLS